LYGNDTTTQEQEDCKVQYFLRETLPLADLANIFPSALLRLNFWIIEAAPIRKWRVAAPKVRPQPILLFNKRIKSCYRLGRANCSKIQYTPYTPLLPALLWSHQISIHFAS
jgi:hypothetical protein